MDRVVRIVGVATIVVAALLAWQVFDRAVTSDGPTPTANATSTPTPTRAERASIGATAADGTSGVVRPEQQWDPWTFGSDDLSFWDSGQEPDRLAFQVGLVSKPYRVGDVAGLGDRDFEPRPERRDYPVETDLFPRASLASTVEIEPGLYATAAGRRGCSYELSRYDSKGVERSIGQDRVSEGRMLVSLDGIEPDHFVPQPQCGGWSPWTPPTEPLEIAGPGDYWIGDLALGVWSVPEGCLWEEVVGFRGARLADVVASGHGPQMLVIQEETMGLRVRHCERPIELAFAYQPPSEQLG